jgi:hypothetical protein
LVSLIISNVVAFLWKFGLMHLITLLEILKFMNSLNFEAMSITHILANN